MPWKKLDVSVEHGPPRFWTCAPCEFVFNERPGRRCPGCGGPLVPIYSSTTYRRPDGSVWRHYVTTGRPFFARRKEAPPPPHPEEN